MARKCKKLGCIDPAVEQGYCSSHKNTDRLEATKQQRVRPDYHRYYNLKEWKYLRSSQLAKQPLCQRCLSFGLVIQAAEIDHIIAHKGDWSLFSDASNLQSLCSSCHSWKTRQEAKGVAPHKLSY